MQNNFSVSSKVLDKNSISNAEVCAITWLGLDKNPNKVYNFKNAPAKFLIHPRSELFGVVALVLKCKFAPVEIIFDERLDGEQLKKLATLKKKNPSFVSIKKASCFMSESYFCIGKNLFITDTQTDSKNKLTNDTAISNAKRNMLKDFYALFDEINASATQIKFFEQEK